MVQNLAVRRTKQMTHFLTEPRGFLYLLQMQPAKLWKVSDNLCPGQTTTQLHTGLFSKDHF